MRTPINKEERSNLTKESENKLKVLSYLIKENVFSRNDKELCKQLGHSAPTVVQNIKKQNLGKDSTVNHHWKSFTTKFKITDEGIYRLEDTLMKYNELKRISRKGLDSYELLGMIEKPPTEKMTKVMKFLSTCDIYEKLAFVGLAIYDELIESKNITFLYYYEKLHELFNKLWSNRNTAICNQFTGLDSFDKNAKVDKLFTIIQTNYNYLLMKQEYEKIKDMPYTYCYNDFFSRTYIEVGSFWVVEHFEQIWYVYDHVVRNGIDIYVMAIFDKYSTKCIEVYRLDFWSATDVCVTRMSQTLPVFYGYSLSDDSKIIQFSYDDANNVYNLPAKLVRNGIENPAVKFLKEGMDEDSIVDVAQIYIYDAITDVNISRQYLTVDTINGTYRIDRDKYPDIKNLHPDDEAFLADINGKEYIIFRGDYALNIPLQEFELLADL